MTKSTRTTQRGGQVPDVRSVNPRYKGAKLSDVARALMRPKDPKVREIHLNAARRPSRSRAAPDSRHMTVNVGLITSDALVFGCDSVASMTEPLLDPFGLLEVDQDGNLIMDENGKFRGL